MILDDISKAKRRRIEDLKSQLPVKDLEKHAADRPSMPLDLYKSLKKPGLSIIAEIKRASPSKGIINGDINPVQRALDYSNHGASAISVLTEQDYFLGSIEDLITVKEVVSLPVLCKDFILEEYQILYAYAKGADAVLLIAALLDEAALKSLFRFAKSMGLSVLLEVHNEQELLSVARTSGRIVGINNRNLNTFHVDLSTFGRISSLIPKECAIVCESGINSFIDAEYAYNNGADALLVGEALMRQSHCGNLLAGLKAYG